MQNAKKHEYKYRSNEYRQNIGEDNISIPLKNAGAMTKSLWLQDEISSSNKPCNHKKVGFLALGLAKEKSPYTRPFNFLRGLSKRFAI